jgi:hypothetical protein
MTGIMGGGPALPPTVSCVLISRPVSFGRLSTITHPTPRHGRASACTVGDLVEERAARQAQRPFMQLEDRQVSHGHSAC